VIRLLILAGLFLLPVQSWAGAMEIDAEKMIFLHKSEQAEFINNVHLKRDDFELRCDRLIAYYANNKLDRAEAFGHIQLIQNNVTGRSEKAILDQKNNTLTLIGNAVLEQEGSRVEGETIVHDMNRDKTVVQPGKGGRTYMTIESNQTTDTVLPKDGQ